VNKIHYNKAGLNLSTENRRTAQKELGISLAGGSQGPKKKNLNFEADARP